MVILIGREKQRILNRIFKLETEVNQLKEENKLLKESKNVNQDEEKKKINKSQEDMKNWLSGGTYEQRIN